MASGGVQKLASVTIDASLVQGQSGTALMAAMVGHSVDLVQTPYTSAILAVEGGIDLVFVSPNNSLVSTKQANGTYRGNSEVIVKANSNIYKASDLKGKMVATVALNDVSSVITKVWLKNAGVDLSTVHFVALPYVAMAEAVESGQVDAAFIAEPFQTKALTDPGVRAIDAPFGWVNRRFPSGGWVALRSWAEQHRDLLKRFRRAQTEAAQAGNALTKEQKASKLQAYFNIDPSIGANVLLGAYDASYPVGAIQQEVDDMVQYGIIPRNIRIASLIFEP